jgi:beta-glucanase (GH16 family)
MVSTQSFSPNTTCHSGTCTIQASIEAGKGWPAFWLLGGDGLLSTSDGCQYQSVYNTWSNVGNCHWSTDTMPNGDSAENDIMEFVEPTYTATRQNLISNGVTQAGNSQTISSAISNFHVYAMHWSNSAVSYAVDGTASPSSWTAHVPVNPEFIILQNRVNSGNVPSSFPQTMTVQYVQVCDGTSCTSPGTAGGNSVFFDNFAQGLATPSAPSNLTGTVH